MTAIDDFLANNEQRSDDLRGRVLDVKPSAQIAIVTCMDCRLDIPAALGLAPGQAHMIRNAGGVVTDDVIRSVTISQRKLGTESIMVIHHSECGMQTITDDGFRAALLEATGMSPGFAIESFTDLEADVRQSVARLRHSAFIANKADIRGFVYDVNGHGLTEVDCR